MDMHICIFYDNQSDAWLHDMQYKIYNIQPQMYREVQLPEILELEECIKVTQWSDVKNEAGP